MKTKDGVPIECKNCGAQLDIDTDKDTVKCPYCGTTYRISDLMGEGEAERTQRIKSRAYKDVQFKKIDAEAELKREAFDIERNREIESREKNFKKSKLNKWLLIFSCISGLMALIELVDGINLVGLIALIQAVMYLVAWLMGRQIVREKRRNLHALIAVIALLLNIPFFMAFNRANDPANIAARDAEKINWSTVVLGESLPTPEHPYGEMNQNTNEQLWCSICKSTDEDYSNYKNQCIGEGYTIDPETVGNSYTAFNQEGFKLKLNYYEHSKEISIELEAPLRMGKYVWPDNAPGKLLPNPVSSVGLIEWEHDDSFLIKVGEMSLEDYNSYVNTVSQAGFNIDYSKGKDFYYADHAAGYHLNTRYEGNNIISVCIESKENVDVPEITEEPTAETPVTTQAEPPVTEDTTIVSETISDTTEATVVVAESAPSNSMRPEFKEAMDGYEEFMDEYVEFMGNYSDSDDPVSMAIDYGKFLGKYVEFTAKFEKWEDNDLNDAELSYYIEVQTRVNQKLLSVVSALPG